LLSIFFIFFSNNLAQNKLHIKIEVQTN